MITDDEFLRAIAYLVEEGVLQNLAYGSLQEDYRALQAEHESLQEEYDALKAESQPANTPDESDAPYVMEIMRCAGTFGFVEAEGFITNNEDVAMTYTATFTLLDESKNPITFENGYAFNVRPGATAPVTAIFLEDIQFSCCRASVSVDY